MVCAFFTLAVAVIVMVTGAGPQSKVMMPPAATAFTTAAEVQLAGVPLPTVRSGLLVFTGRAAAGIEARPAGLPGLGSVDSLTVFDGDGATERLTDGATDGDPGPGAAEEAGAATKSAGSSPDCEEHAPTTSRLNAAATSSRRIRIGGC
ncbi:hypothetical protein Are01nite_25010 [Actinoplanes regularis]|nr:hypothetical protein Are01nite_25010 [Actinoplanes regularis]